MDYEKESADLEKILAFHVSFERIRPFADYNGRVGRLILVKECLRYGVAPFILHDKRRAAYYRGIARWDEDSLLRLDGNLPPGGILPPGQPPEVVRVWREGTVK